MDPWEEHLARQRSHEIAQLRYHWEDAYEFGWSGGRFWAKRADDGETLTAETAFDLRELVICNYSERRVSRDLPGPDRSGEPPAHEPTRM